MSAAEPPQGANSAPAGGSAAAKPQARGDHTSTVAAVPVTKARSRSPTAILVRKLFRRKLVLAGAAILVVVTLLALFAPWITPFGPMTMKISDRMQSPRLAHWFGTDELGRDVFSRVVFGARYSLMIGASVVVISVTGGVLLGLVEIGRAHV